MGMKANNAWAVFRSRSGGRATLGDFRIVPSGDRRITEYDSSWPIAPSGSEALEQLERNILALYHHITQLGVPPVDVHSELLKIDEYVDLLEA